MDAAVGGGNPGNGPGSKPAATLKAVFPTPMFYAVKANQLVAPGPSDSWAFTDEHPDSIDDGILYTSPMFTDGYGAFSELPSSLHGSADGQYRFADGHAEIHKWTDSRTGRRRCPVQVNIRRRKPAGHVHLAERGFRLALPTHAHCAVIRPPGGGVYASRVFLKRLDGMTERASSCEITNAGWFANQRATDDVKRSSRISSLTMAHQRSS